MANAPTFCKVNYQYAAPNGALRSGSFIFAEPSLAAAKNRAIETIKANWDIYKITSVTEYKPD